MNLLSFDELLNSKLPYEAAIEMENIRTPNKDWIGQESITYKYEDFSLNEGQNRYTIVHEDVPFECLYLPKPGKKLCVMFSGGGRGVRHRSYPLFLRWKYKNHLNSSILCIDDPMYYFHPEIKHVTWYYGTKDTSYLHLLLDIVKKFMDELSVSAENVTFIGSSGGGYAALYCANLMDYSKAIAMNPQIIIKNWKYPEIYNDFLQWGIDLEAKDKFERNRLSLTNKTSYFMIVMNANSVDEYEKQFVPFFESHEITPQYGITQTDNIITWIHAADYSDPHSAILEKVGVAFADYLLKLAQNGADLNEISNLSVLANEVLYEKLILEDNLEKTTNEKNILYEIFSAKVKELLQKKVPLQISDSLNKIIKDDGEISSAVIKTGAISYHIGNQKIYRYNLFYKKGKMYFCMKFDGFSKYFANTAEVMEYLESLSSVLSNWCVLKQKDTLKVSIQLKPETAEQQINEFIDMSINMCNKYLL